MIDTPTLLSVAAFLLAFAVAMIHVRTKGRTRACVGRALVGASVVLLTLSVVFLVCSVMARGV